MSIQQDITTKLASALQPSHLEVLNESHGHNVPAGSESHFKVTVVCNQFEGQNQVQRQRSVYALLSAELAGAVHALALHTYSPAEWQTRAGTSPESPNCMGGSKA